VFDCYNAENVDIEKCDDQVCHLFPIDFKPFYLISKPWAELSPKQIILVYLNVGNNLVFSITNQNCSVSDG